MKHMKQHIISSIKLIAIGAILAGAVSYVNASTWTSAPGNPPTNNVPTPLHIGSIAQVKNGALGVGAFNARQAAQFNSTLYLTGIVRGGTPLDTSTSSVVRFGLNSGTPPFIESLISGELFAQDRFRVGVLSNSFNSAVCADRLGQLVLCNVMPQVTLNATDLVVPVNGTTSLSVKTTGFRTLNTCIIDQGIGAVAMTEVSDGVWETTSAVLSNAIPQPTVFRVDCSGTSLSGSFEQVAATRLIGIVNSTSGYYAHCFIADTQVTMADGSKKNIQDVQIGDVLKGETTNNTVLGYHQPTLDDGKLYGFNGDEAFVTAEHPFMTTEGWKSINPEKTKIEHIGLLVTQLEVGDELVTEQGTITVTSIESKDAPTTTKLYNFILDGDHTYYADGYLVHNKELCNAQYPACPGNGICIDSQGLPTPGTGSCAVNCIPGQPVIGGYCKPGDVLTCSAEGYKICL